MKNVELCSAEKRYTIKEAHIPYFYGFFQSISRMTFYFESKRRCCNFIFFDKCKNVQSEILLAWNFNQCWHIDFFRTINVTFHNFGLSAWQRRRRKILHDKKRRRVEITEQVLDWFSEPVNLEKWVIAIGGIGHVLTTLILVMPLRQDHMILVLKTEIVPVEIVVMTISLKDQDHQVCMVRLMKRSFVLTCPPVFGNLAIA